MPFPKNRRTTVVLALAGIAVFISLFIFLPPESGLGHALRTKGVGFAAFVIAFGLAVFIHELGHFLAAKAFKVPVERFVIGFDKEAMPAMPRCIWEKKIGETTYGLSLMPLGGYVKMSGVVHPDIEAYLEGDDKKDVRAEEVVPPAEESIPIKDDGTVREDTLTGQAIMDQAALYKKPFYQKVIIYSAGVIMNLVLAMVIVVGIDVAGRTQEVPLPPVVSWQAPDTWISEQGIEQGDLIVAVNETPIADQAEFEEAYWSTVPPPKERQKDETRVLSLTLSRDGKEIKRDLEYLVAADPNEISDEEVEIVSMISWPAYVDFVELDSPADMAGITHGDKIVRLGDEPIDDWQELVYIIRNNLGEELDIAYVRDGNEIEASVKPFESRTNKEQGQIGIVRGPGEKQIIKKDFVTAVTEAPGFILSRTVMYVQNLGKIGSTLARGDIKQVRRDLGGPVAIARMASQQANISIEYYLNFLVMFNIALAIINILPIPILDGGHIVLAAYEAVFRKPLPAKVLVPVLNGAFILLITLFILITFSDISKWLKLGWGG